jgi:hypothetical protein
MAKLIGNAPNQVPTNADLGSMAFEDKKNYATTSSPIYQPYRNIIINGDMSIAQRGTSESGITGSTFGYFTVDRWRIGVDNIGTWTMSQDTDVPTGQGFASSLKLECTTADASPSASDALFLNQNFEGQMLQYLKKGTANAESLTLSFWVKSNKTGTYTISLDDNDNNRNIVGTYIINSSDTWEKKTLTFEGDTIGAFDNDNNNSLRFYFWLGVGSNYNSGTLATSWENTVTANLVSSSNVNLADSTSNYINITGVQLEAGTASDFEFLPYDVNLDRCLRYCYVVGDTPTYGEISRYSNIGTYYTATQMFTGLDFPVVMRTTPSLTVVGSNPAQAFTTYSSNTARTSTAVGKDSSSATNIGYVITTSSATQGDGGIGAWNIGYYGIISAEL